MIGPLFKRLRRRIRQFTPFYYLRARFWNRYHIVDCRNPRNGYSWGWFDRSELMLFANFAILVDFVEKEEPWGPDRAHDCGHPEAKAALLDLYTWWTKGRAEEHDVVFAMRVPDLRWGPVVDRPSYSRLLPLEGQDRVDMDAFSAALDAFEAKDGTQLLRLLQYRGHLWT